VLASPPPLLTLFLAIVQRQERFRFTGLVGALIATAGTAIVFREQLGADVPVWSIVAVLLASACAAEGGVVLKRFPPTDPVSTNAVAMSVGAVVLLALSIAAGETWILPEQASTWVAFAYLATLGTLGTFLLYLFVLKTWTASAASYEFVLAPIVAIALAAWLLDESVSTGFFLGGALVLAGVYVGALMPSRETPATLPGRPETP
jgi:drug/metabolite transporter (DMT)-like permease